MKVLATKIGMTSVFTEKGDRIPVTVLSVGPSRVLAVKTAEKHGYDAMVIGQGAVKPHQLDKAMAGHYKKAGVEAARTVREIPLDGEKALEVGSSIDASAMKDAKWVDVIGVTIGKGFQGVVKRYRFHGGPGGHGSNFHRRIGSAGQNTDPARVMKGKKMPGRMGGQQRTTMNLEVFKTDLENNLLLVKGSVPGSKNGLVWVRKAVKRS